MTVAVGLYSSCSLHDDTEIFDETASARLQTYLTESQAVLRSAEKGWVMDYYVGDDQEYGGYAYFVKFDSLTVTASSELTTEECTSYYKMTTDDGPVLTFDTYNTVLHELATPSSSNYEAYHADFEFIIMSATEDLVTLKGKKTGSLMTLRPLTTSVDEYMADLTYIQDEMITSTAIGTTSAGTTINAALDFDNRQADFVNPNDTSFTYSCAFVYTDKGIRLYQPLEVDSESISDFSYDVNSYVYSCLDEGSTSFSMQGYIPEDYVTFEKFEGDYTFTFEVENDEGGYDEESFDVTLTPSDDGTYYLMSGVCPNFDVVLNFNKTNGALEMHTQNVGTYTDGSQIWFNAAYFANGSGSVYPAVEEFGVITSWNMDADNPVYYWVNHENDYTEYYGFVTNSFCMWLTDDAGNSVSQLYGDSNYMLGGGYNTLTFVKSLIKK